MKSLPPHRQAQACECGDHGFVGLTRGRTALFPADKLGLVSRDAWFIYGGKAGYVYAAKYLAGRIHNMHRMLLGLSHGDPRMVDHVNGDRLDNRDGNLRLCSAAENNCNRKVHANNKSQFRGVYRLGKRWAFQVQFGGIRRGGYTFQTPEEAARAYDAAALELHGAFARTNQQMGLL